MAVFSSANGVMRIGDYEWTVTNVEVSMDREPDYRLDVRSLSVPSLVTLSLELVGSPDALQSLVDAAPDEGPGALLEELIPEALAEWEALRGE